MVEPKFEEWLTHRPILRLADTAKVNLQDPNIKRLLEAAYARGFLDAAKEMEAKRGSR